MSSTALRLLAVNSGAASVRFALYEVDGGLRRLASASFEGIGLSMGRATVTGEEGRVLLESGESIPNHETAARRMHEWLSNAMPGLELAAIGHRVVQGAPGFAAHQRIDAALMAELERLALCEPGQAVRYLRVIRVLGELYPSVPAVACFDTLLHRSMPRTARMYPLPRELFEQGVARYGIHGLSCGYVLGALAANAGEDAAQGRVVVAHLGCSSSISAFKAGTSVDCTSGFTPSGLMMGTRPGDLGAGVLLHLMLSKGLSPAELANMVSFQSGLLGVSKVSRDMRELLKVLDTNPNAADAVALYCYSARKHLAGMVAALGGIDTLIFTGGVGQGEFRVRRLICENLEFTGIRLDAGRNKKGAAVISPDGSPVTVRVMATDEEVVIARETAAVLSSAALPGGA